MANNRNTNLVGTIISLYRKNCGLFWRIMLPVAIIAILLDIGMFFRFVNFIEKHFDNQPDYTATGSLNTRHGIDPTYSGAKIVPSRMVENGGKETRFSPSVSWQFLPFPYVSAINRDGSIWEWSLNFRSIDYTPLILLLLTLCPLSLVVARLSSNSRFSDVPLDPTLLTAGEAWRQTGKKAFTVLVAAVLFVLIVDIGNYIYIGITWLIPSLTSLWPITLITILIILPYFYFLVTLSLYNPCLILENRSIIGIFKRSHALVSGARLHFLKIYLLTGWIAAIITSVLRGTVLLLFSVSFSELTPIREALTPLKFLSLFVGGNVGVMLPKLPGILPTVLLLIVKGIITTFLVPVWAIVTTYLYLERTDMMPEVKKEA